MKIILTIVFLSLIKVINCYPHIDEYHYVFEEPTNVIKLSRQEFYDYLSIPESNGIYNIANSINMVGKYQASRIALKTFGFSDEKINKIRNSIKVTFNSNNRKLYHFDTLHFPSYEQEKFIDWYMNFMENRTLKHYISKYDGKVINGTKITKASILGTSILSPEHLKKYLDSDGKINFKDGYNTSIEKRLKYFENIEII